MPVFPGIPACMHPFVATAAVGTTALASLSLYLLLIAAAAFAGGSSMAFVRLGHRPMQVLLSLTSGILLGVGLLHLLPHAAFALAGDGGGSGIEAAAGWAAVGFFVMFLLERAFHGHAHHTAEGPEEAPAHGHPHDPTHGHAHDPAYACPASAGRWAWCGAFAGLALHSLADGAALAASVRADASHGDGVVSGFATFLAILLHKPFDSAIIATLMLGAGAAAGFRATVNAAYALMVPLGAFGFVVGLRFFGAHEGTVLGVAMGMAAGAFICIAAADLLPEVQFHSHDRLLLTTALALGMAVAWGITQIERATHAHEAHTGRAAARDHGHPH
jgi:zinc and cadmium transporter